MLSPRDGAAPTADDREPSLPSGFGPRLGPRLALGRALADGRGGISRTRTVGARDADELLSAAEVLVRWLDGSFDGLFEGSVEGSLECSVEDSHEGSQIVSC